MVDMVETVKYNSHELFMAGKKILIVDYDSQSLDSLVQAFSTSKHDLITATDGLSAYEKFQSEKPDLVILEAILPKLHGFELTQKITQESGGSTPVVIVTGLYRGPQYRNEALSVFGASAYFEKPFDRNQLLTTVNDLLREETDLGLELPKTEVVIEYLSRKLKKRSIPE